MLNKNFSTATITASLVVILTVLAWANLDTGTKAPNFKLPSLSAKTITLSSYFAKSGNVVVLDIWATWCPPCRSEIPHLVKLQTSYKGKPVKVVGVAIDDELATVKAFAKENKINYTVCHDASGKTISRPYRVEGIPATYIIDRKGVIRFAHSGFPGDSESQKREIVKMKQEISSLL